MEKKVTPPWHIALIVTLLLILANIVIYVTNQLLNKSFLYFQFLAILFSVIIGCILYAKENKGEITFGNIFSHGFKITAGIASLTAIYIFISIKFIHPEIIEMKMNEARTVLEKQGKITSDQIDEYIQNGRENYLISYISIMIFFMALFGVIGSLIGAGVAKKNPINPFQNAS